MRIYGGHDYYDCGLSMGIDPTVVLIRGKSGKIPIEAAGGTLLRYSLELSPLPRNLIFDRYQPRVAVAFCNKVYRGLRVDGGIWSPAKAREWAASQSKNGKIEVHQSWSEDKIFGRASEVTLEDYFQPFDAPIALRDYMIRNKISILVQHEDHRLVKDHFLVNPATLGKLNFAKAVDPYTAFQELSMWIGGVLGGTSPAIEKITDDKVLIENHGYDKHSFRSSTREA